MFAIDHVAMRIAMLLLPGLLYAMPAASQGERDAGRSSETPPQSKSPQAPIAHRQPTPADFKDLPRTPVDAAQAKRDRELDAKLRICRNC
jgi:hypothetical protein